MNTTNNDEVADLSHELSKILCKKVLYGTHCLDLDDIRSHLQAHPDPSLYLMEKLQILNRCPENVWNFLVDIIDEYWLVDNASVLCEDAIKVFVCCVNEENYCNLEELKCDIKQEMNRLGFVHHFFL